MEGIRHIKMGGDNYVVRYHIQKGSKEGGLSPDIPDHIDDMEVWREELVKVIDEETVNKIYEILMYRCPED